MQEIKEDALESVIGPSAMQEYMAATDHEKAGVRRFAANLRGMTDEEFLRVCEERVLGSARMQRFKGMNDLHAMAYACHYEGRRRHEAAGHARDCWGQTLYGEGFDRVYASQGHNPGEPHECTCGKS